MKPDEIQFLVLCLLSLIGVAGLVSMVILVSVLQDISKRIREYTDLISPGLPQVPEEPPWSIDKERMSPDALMRETDKVRRWNDGEEDEQE